MPTTARYDLIGGIVTTLTTFRTANPDLLRGVTTARPESYPDLPAAFPDAISESVLHDSGTRTRTMTASVLVVRRITNNAETMAAWHVLVDLLADAFTAVPQFSANTIWSRMTITDEDAPFGDYDFAGVRFTFTDMTVMEGRN